MPDVRNAIAATMMQQQQARGRAMQPMNPFSRASNPNIGPGTPGFDRFSGGPQPATSGAPMSPAGMAAMAAGPSGMPNAMQSSQMAARQPPPMPGATRPGGAPPLGPGMNRFMPGGMPSVDASNAMQKQQMAMANPAMMRGTMGTSPLMQGITGTQQTTGASPAMMQGIMGQQSNMGMTGTSPMMKGTMGAPPPAAGSPSMTKGSVAAPPSGAMR